MQKIFAILCVVLLGGCAGPHAMNKEPNKNTTQNAEHSLLICTSDEMNKSEIILFRIKPGQFEHFILSKTGKPMIVGKKPNGQTGGYLFEDEQNNLIYISGTLSEDAQQHRTKLINQTIHVLQDSTLEKAHAIYASAVSKQNADELDKKIMKFNDVLSVRTEKESGYSEQIFMDLTPGYYTYFKASNTGKPFVILKLEDENAGFMTETARGLTYITTYARMQTKEFIVFANPTTQPINTRLKYIYNIAERKATATAAKEQKISVDKSATHTKGSAKTRLKTTKQTAGPTPAAEDKQYPTQQPAQALRWDF
jgi:hypothetical protein